jgi:hypothetical protein
MMIEDYDVDDHHVMTRNDFHLFHNVNEQMNVDDDNLSDDDDCYGNDMDENEIVVVVVLEMDFEENDEY